MNVNENILDQSVSSLLGEWGFSELSEDFAGKY